VTVARSLPMLVLGALAGAVGEALNRKTLLLGGFLLMAANATVLWLLAAHGRIAIWHIAVGGTVAGTVWATELAVRRRMIGEVMPPAQVGLAVAFDTLTASVARMLGPLAGGIVFETIGLAGAYLLSAVLYLVAALFIIGLGFRQERQKLRFARIPADIAEGLRMVRRQGIILGVVLVTIVTNLFGFSYAALVAPLGMHKFLASPALVGALAAAEPLGAMVTGLALAAGWIGLDRRRGMIRGSFLFLAGIAAAALAPWYALAVAALLLGGCGTAAFSVMQSTLVLTETPAAVRSRVMGIVTVCIGTGPLGVLGVGLLSEWAGPSPALLAMTGAGLLCLALVRVSLPVLRPKADP
jgi:predicted MFS family arabinose efflux permease